MRSWVLAVCVAAVGLSGCAGAPEVDPDRRLSWRELERDGTGHRVAVFLSTHADDGEARGFLGLIDDEGRTDFLTTEARADGLLAARDGGLCAADRRWTYRLTASGGQRRARGGVAEASNRWVGVRPDGGCVRVVSDAQTEVRWESDGRDRRSVVPGIVGPVGLSPDALWVRNGAGSPAEPLRLDRTDLASGETAEHMSWPVRFDGEHATDLFWYDGRLVYLEDLAEVEGDRTELRLAELDPVARRADSTLLRRGISRGDASGQPAAAATRAGHLDGDTLYTVDDGEIVGVDLVGKKARLVGTLSPESTEAVDVAAAWQGDRLHLVLVGADDAVVLETYDLATGERVARQDVDGWDSLLDGDRVVLTSAPALGEPALP